jgi:cytochrome b involved in lipid metabolism
MDEVMMHPDPDDCLLVYYDMVYNMTEYATVHPGGDTIITNLCSTNATEKYSMFHHEALLELVKDSYLGVLEGVARIPAEPHRQTPHVSQFNSHTGRYAYSFLCRPS